jgi:hypothetical protein
MVALQLLLVLLLLLVLDKFGAALCRRDRCKFIEGIPIGSRGLLLLLAG